MRRSHTRIVVGALAFLLLGGVQLRAETVDSVNAKVAQIDKRIADHDKSLPSIVTNYDFYDATENFPPQMSFYFESETKKLVACVAWVGHETWGESFAYYFDENGNILKYLQVILPPDGVVFDTTRYAIIYNTDGTVLWRNVPESPQPTPEAIKALYKALAAAGDEFSQ
jgi:hypothetical protein